MARRFLPRIKLPSLSAESAACSGLVAGLIVGGAILFGSQMVNAASEGLDDISVGLNPLDNLPQFSVIPLPPERIEIESEGTIDYDNKTSSLIYEAGKDPLIRVKTDKDTELFSEKAVFHLDKKHVDLSGDVSIYQGASITRADWARYFWENRTLETRNLKTKVNGFILEADKFVVKEDEKGRSYYEGIDAGVSLQDIDKPDSWLRGGRIRLYPEDSVEFKHLKVYVGEYPIFYFPYFSHSLNPKLGYLPMVGARSIWGAYLNNEYGIVIGEKYVEHGIPTGDMIGTFHLDARTRRGLAFGFDLERPKERKAHKDFKGLSLYYAADQGEDIQLEGIPRLPISADRWMMQYQDRFAQQDKGADSWWWRLDTNLTVLSDAYFLEDFMPSIVQQDQQPDNTVVVAGQKGSHVLTGLFRFAPNDHYYTDERYPEVTWDRIRGPVLSSSIQYEGSTSFGIMRQYVPNERQREATYQLSRISKDDPRYQAYHWDSTTDPYARFNTYHELERPIQAGVFTLTPKVGGGYTGYYDVSGVGGSHDRALFYAGLGANTRLTGEFSDVKSDFWGLNGLKHVVEPYVDYSFVSTNEMDPSIPRLDDWPLSTNPVSLSVGRFTAIDSLSSWNTVRMGLRNILMTNRGGGSHQWLKWDVFVDGYLNDPELDRRFSNMYSYTTWNIKPWVSFSVMNQFPIIDSGSGYQEHNFYTTFMPNRYMEFKIGNRNLINHPIIQDSNLLDTEVNFHLSDESALSALFRWELNDSTLERQEYMYYRNLGSWVLGVGFYSYYNRIQHDTGVMVTFSLKEFPSMKFPFRF